MKLYQLIILNSLFVIASVIIYLMLTPAFPTSIQNTTTHDNVSIISVYGALISLFLSFFAYVMSDD